MAGGEIASGVAASLAKGFEPVGRLIDVLASGAAQAFTADAIGAWSSLLFVIAILVFAVLASIVKAITSWNRNTSERDAVKAVENLGKTSPENAKTAMSVLRGFLGRRKS